MLAKQNRITKQVEFDQFFGVAFRRQGGRNFSTKNLIVKILNTGQKQPRVGFVLSTKVDKRATVRNRIKRQLREVIRLNFAQIKAPVDILIVAQPAIKNLEYPALEQELTSLLKRAKLL